MNQQHLQANDLKQFDGKNPLINFTDNQRNRIGLINKIKPEINGVFVASFVVEMSWSIQIYEMPPIVGVTVERIWKPFAQSMQSPFTAKFEEPGKITYQNNGILIRCKNGPVFLTTDPSERDRFEAFRESYEEIMAQFENHH